MAMFETTRTAPFGAESIHKVVVLFDTAMEEIRVRIHALRVRNALSKLSARELADIGLGEKDLYSNSLEIARRAL